MKHVSIKYDEDCPELTEEELAEFKPVNFATMEERAQAMKQQKVTVPYSPAQSPVFNAFHWGLVYTVWGDGEGREMRRIYHEQTRTRSFGTHTNGRISYGVKLENPAGK